MNSVTIRPFAMLLAFVLNLGAGSMMAKEDEAQAPQSSPRPLAEVFKIVRPRGTDLLLLWNGDKLTGIILNDTVSLRTSYGQLKFGRGMLAGIDLDTGARGLESVITVNSNRFSGFLEDASFTFQPQTGSRTDVRREKVLKVLFHVRETELPELPSGRWVRLKNGDYFSGQLLPELLSVVTSRARVPVSAKEIKSMLFTANRPSLTTITLRNQVVLQGHLVLEDIPIRLDVGPTIQLYQDWIDVIRDDPGAETERLAAGQPPADPGDSVVVSSTSSSTNLERMVWIPAGEFIMGSPTDEPGRDQDEGPQTKVTIAQGFWMGKCEVTQAEYQTVMGTNPSNVTEDKTRPVERVNWYEAMEYCTKLTESARTAGKLPKGYAYRLPTEAEWEYACRAGTTTRFSYGDDKGYLQLADYAWFTRNSESMTHPVGTRRPNPWGLFDMHGNVWEWCLDRWEGSLPGGSVTNLAVPAGGPLCVARGGSWLYEGEACRSANRDDYSPSNRCSDIGFRVVLAPYAP